MEQLLGQIYATELVEWIATGTALIYVWLAARDNNWCWFFAAVSALLWAYQSFIVYRLVSDALLQGFYFVMAGVGLFRWHRSRATRPDHRMLDAVAIQPASETETAIFQMNWREHAVTIGLGLVVGLLLGYAVGAIATATQTYLDAITTSFSIIATFLLIWRRLENWLYWIVIDAVYVYIYLRSGAVLFALLMVLYVAMAIYGYFQWRSSVHRSHEAAR
ncbi:nicotinamide mononucleotide transporter [Lewinella aquimaris]|uniref:Nicotinamide riboside transporter PnuC n=1 Tax=Neolewinella aquimaris TaxID=1835722 RepID=A0A840E6R3_9BACT|nr:nicotinamide riboside transporter PnuC [Neolewinella aquimaris]MBB4079643.1 nicotinamide mononucleotide transporter [Neolewinella aquimaris]